LGSGLLESIYEEVLAYELTKSNLKVQRQQSVESVHAVHHAQLLTYLRLANKPLGLLTNFNTVLVKNGIKRVVNRLPEA
jgi:hypothetical protein